MSPPRVLFLGSYPPRECGIATFTKDMVDAYDRAFGDSTPVIAIDEPGAEVRRYPPEVVARIAEQDRASYTAAAEFVNSYPVELVNIQHEYGLFGGERGEWLVDFLRAVEKPAVLTLHTVLPEPDETYLRVTRELCEEATKVVALSETGRGLLEEIYGIDPQKLEVIHHGVPDVPFQDTNAAKASFGIGQRTVISTFGLISRGKGLEYAIEAMREVVKRHPETLYLILGETHPVVRRQEGESYRESLHAMVRAFGLQYNVQLVDKYLDFDEVVSYLAATDIYLTPYLNPAQIVSGTLAYAVGCGKAIVSTPYLYAQELLAHNRGFLCEFRDAVSIGMKLGMLLDDPSLRRATERRAYRFGRQMTWPHVAAAYGRLFTDLCPDGPLELVTSA
ncbi:MAG: glycosyltransferase family 4 protein [Candidatus Cybelea sp.]|jgi:polysaccharide biosynthesis protein PslF